MALLDTLRKAIAEGDVDVLREGVHVLAQAIMEAEVGELTGVPRGETGLGACSHHQDVEHWLYSTP